MTIRVALVDDHPVVIGGIQAGLAEIGDLAVVACGGTLAEATAILARTDVDVVLLDVRLADGNALSMLGRADHRAGPAIIVLSSFLTTQYIAAAIRFGVQGFLLKTAPLHELVDAIRHVAGGGSWFTAEQLRAARGGFVTLTGREREVVRLVLAGHTNDEIAARLRISSKAIEGHLSRMFARFGVASRLELGLRAEREGWLDVDSG